MADGKRGKTCLSEFLIGFGFTSDWMKKWQEFFSQSCSVKVMQKQQLLLDTQNESFSRGWLMHSFQVGERCLNVSMPGQCRFELLISLVNFQ